MRRRALVLVLLLPWLATPARASSPLPLLNIIVDSGGVAHVRAMLDLPASPGVVRGILIDYSHWPMLFPQGLRVAAIKQEPDGVQTDLYLPRYFLPGEFHLVTLTRETAPGRLETSLIEGDFLRYQRVWSLTPGERNDETHAALEMDVQPKTWMPNWIFTILLRHELAEHFDKLRAEVERRLHP